MKGTIVNRKGQWFVQYWEQLLPPNENKKVHNEKPLHPDDATKIQEAFNDTFTTKVEFEIVSENVDIGALEAPYIKVTYAKLIKQEETNTWDEIFNEMKESQREDYYGFLNYLKENYSVPVKLKK